MKALFIAYSQAYNEEIVELLERHGQRGFTRWDEVYGRGSVSGEPHLGNHAWPAANHAILAMVPDDKVDAMMADLKAADAESSDLGLRAFVWNIEMFC